MFEVDFFEAFEVECKGLGRGKLDPLSLAHMIEMRGAIRDDLFDLMKNGLSSDERVKAAAAAASHVADMSLIDQAQAIVNSQFLMAKAATLMLGESWAPMQAAGRIGREHLPAIRKAVQQSYGVRFVAAEPGEAKTDADPPEAATSSAS